MYSSDSQEDGGNTELEVPRTAQHWLAAQNVRGALGLFLRARDTVFHLTDDANYVELAAKPGVGAAGALPAAPPPGAAAVRCAPHAPKPCQRRHSA